jgi:hypothetical protein
VRRVGLRRLGGGTGRAEALPSVRASQADLQGALLRRLRSVAEKGWCVVTPRHKAALAICARVAHMYGISVDELLGESRTKTIAEARAVAMWVTRQELSWSFPEIGRAFQRDHTTVMHCCQRVDSELISPRRGSLVAITVKSLYAPAAGREAVARGLPN